MNEAAFPAQQFYKTSPSGPWNAEVMIVGEAPGANEEAEGIPFVGRAGDETDAMLEEAGWLPKGLHPIERRKQRNARFFLTNVCKYRPPENKIETFFLDSKKLKPNELIQEGLNELVQEIKRVKPKLIIALGDIAHWGLTRQHGITKWRGSMLSVSYTDSDGVQRTAMYLPTYHPALILYEWSWRSIAVHDLRRAREALEAGHWPPWPTSFLVRPSFTDAMDCLGTLIRKANEGTLPIASDLETRKLFISCHSIAWSEYEAICLPNLCVEQPEGYWTLDQDVALWERERALLTHPNVEVIGQNYLYDAQYFARRRGYVPRLRHDTMFMQHVAWPGLPKRLDFLSSMYCRNHVYWKEEGKEWHPGIPEEQHWVYGCTDAVRTYEIAFALLPLLERLGLMPQYEFQMSLWKPTLRMMLRGVRIDLILRSSIGAQLFEAITDREQRLQYILGYAINLDSPKQVHSLFYNQLQCEVVKNRKTGRPTCDEDALAVFVRKEPLLRPICQLIAEIRSLGAMQSNVIMAQLDADKRLRSELDPAGAETFRYASRKNAFYGGTNLQNWTKGAEEEEEA